MRLVLTSDLHGHLPDVPPCDVLLVAGDVCPIHDHTLEFQADWLRHDFCDWLRGVPARHKLFTAGNHDYVFALQPGLLEGIRWPGTYLFDSGAVCDGVRFWGSPWATFLHGWPFTAPEDKLLDYWELIPPDTQVLMVHGPPHGVGDIIIGNLSGDVLHVGSKTLIDTIDRLPELRLVVFGHIHECAGVYERGTLTLVNAAVMDENYLPVNPVRVVEMEV
jgi:hypothetical protein